MPDVAGKKFKKMVRIVDGLFQNNGRTIDEITNLLGITKKELISTMQTASMCGLPPYDPSSLIDAYIEDDRVHVSHVWGLFSRPTQLTRDEAFSLFLAGRAVAAALPDSSPHLKSALKKMQDVLRPEDAKAVADSSAMIDINSEAASASIIPVLNILKGATGREKLLIQYYSAGKNELIERTVRPYGLIYNIEQWYCVSYCELRESIRLFRVDRIKTASPTGTFFNVPPEFDLEVFKRNEMFKMIERPHRVCLRFSPDAAYYAVEKWPDRANKESTGHVCVTFHVDRLENFVGTVLGFGKNVEIVSPPEFIAMVKTAAGKTLSIYEDK